MKTRDRILAESLTLFNAQGERAVSTNHIAAHLGISPGNLYYHFKGKDPIIHTLFVDFERSFKTVLQAAIEAPLELADNWVYFYVLFEEVADFRFFYRNQQSLIERYMDLEPRFKALVSLKVRSMAAIISGLEKQGFLSINVIEAEEMARRFAQQLTYWPIYSRIMAPNISLPVSIHHGVFSMIIQLTPYVSSGSEEFLQLITEFRDKMLKSFSNKITNNCSKNSCCKLSWNHINIWIFSYYYH